MMDESHMSPVTSELVTIAAVFESLATVVVFLRFWLRLSYKQGIKSDDWLALFSLAVSWAYAILVFDAGARIGVDVIKVDPVTAARGFVKAIAINAFLLIFVIVPIKMSVLMFYKRIFGEASKTFTLCVWIAMGTVTAWGIVLFVAQMLIGDPTPKSIWENIETPKYRFDYFKFGISIPVCSVIFDGLILLFPIPMLKKLQLPMKKKIFVFGMFSLGSFCLVTGGIRTHFWIENAELVTNPNIVNVNKWKYDTLVQIWIFLEMTISVIAACLPTLGPLVTKGIYERVTERVSGLSYLFRFSRNTSAEKTDISKKGSSLGQRFGSGELPISMDSQKSGQTWSESGSQRSFHDTYATDIELGQTPR